MKLEASCFYKKRGKNKNIDLKEVDIKVKYSFNGKEKTILIDESHEDKNRIIYSFLIDVIKNHESIEEV